LREDAISALAGFHAGPPLLVELEFGVLFFVEGGKPDNPGTVHDISTFGNVVVHRSKETIIQSEREFGLT